VPGNDAVAAEKDKTMMTVVSDSGAAADRFAAIKARQQAMWGSGDFAVIGTTLQIVGEQLAEAADVGGVDRVLDVAAGNGNATLAAARRFATVTSTDYVAELLERGRVRAEADGLANVTFEVADAEALPYPDASFDVVLSTFGVMFAPDHQRAAGEMMRVCKPGGRIGLASWTPAGFLGKLFRAVGEYVPPIPGVQSPLLWGTDAHLAELFAGAATIRHTTRFFAFRYRSAEHWVDVFRSYYGPVHKAFAALDEKRQAALEADLLALLRHSNSGDAHGLVVQAEYLETVITR
jgi:ubiquinone/menaquinone biosynthesis C-methylase UbiE